ncbi:MAG: porin family protein [Spirochaetaceae bacterium]|jgi:hypothetical protein|nr:porin family protein [Spirochaetaceae bacterium]
MRRKALSLFFTLWLGLPLGAQEEAPDEEIPITSDWSQYTPFGYSRGDQMLAISPTFIFPMFFVGKSGIMDPNMSVIGIGLTLGYNYFLSPHFFLGGEVTGIAITSKAKNWLFMVPFGVKVGWQFNLHHTQLPIFLRGLEFPVSLMIGGEVQSYLNHEENYFGLFLKPGVGAFFRFHQSWSAGIQAEWWWVPQWPKDEPSKNVDGHFLEITATIRYHF